MKVELVPHQPEWLNQYREEAERLRSLLGERIIAMYHAGSTSIPGIKAKPVIDVLVVVDDITCIASYVEGMVGLGYTAEGEFGIPGRRFFHREVDGKRTHNVHIFQQGHAEIARMLAFRDYLSAHPEDAIKYERLKEELARRFPSDTTVYARGKSDFVEGVIRKARQEKIGNQDY